MDELIAFVRAQLDEDERVARAPLAGRARTWKARGAEVFYPSEPWRDDPNDDGLMTVATAATGEDAEHIARWDPARVLAEVEAKRRILELHYPVDPCDAHDAAMETAPCETLLALAQPYAGRDGWREEWRF